jgi:hypothetical protein
MSVASTPGGWKRRHGYRKAGNTAMGGQEIAQTWQWKKADMRQRWRELDAGAEVADVVGWEKMDVEDGGGIVVAAVRPLRRRIRVAKLPISYRYKKHKVWLRDHARRPLGLTKIQARIVSRINHTTVLHNHHHPPSTRAEACAPTAQAQCRRHQIPP